MANHPKTINKMENTILCSQMTMENHLERLLLKQNYLPITTGEIVAKAPGFIISRNEADATIATQRL